MSKIKYEIITGIVVATIIFLLAGFFIFVLVAYMNRRKKKHILEKETMQMNFKQEILQAQLEIQNQTLQNISEEIHDNIGQVLSLAKLHLGTLDTPDDPKMQDKITQSRNLVSKAIQDLRHLSHSMNIDYISSNGFHKMVANELDIIRKSGTYLVNFELIGTPKSMDRQMEVISFRIIQELLNNILKHAEAKIISLSMEFKNQELLVCLKDDGHGFDIEQLNSNRFGIGIRNMRKRANLIGADLSIESISNKGTTCELILPLTPVNDTDNDGNF